MASSRVGRTQQVTGWRPAAFVNPIEAIIPLPYDGRMFGFVKWLAKDWAADALLTKGVFLVAIGTAIWQWLQDAGPQIIFLVFLCTILVGLVIRIAYLDWNKKRETGSELPEKSHRDIATQLPLYVNAACVLIVSLGMIYVISQTREEPAPPSLSTQQIVTSWIRELGLKAKLGNQQDYRDVAFQYELSLPQGRAQLYARTDDPPYMITIEGDVQISAKCYDSYTEPRSQSLNNIQSAMLPAGINVLPGSWYDKRRLLFKSTLPVDPNQPAQVFFSRLQNLSWAHRIGREMSNIVCEGDNHPDR